MRLERQALFQALFVLTLCDLGSPSSAPGVAFGSPSKNPSYDVRDLTLAERGITHNPSQWQKLADVSEEGV
jgi:hypothetical protein